MAAGAQKIFDGYQKRFAFVSPQIAAAPPPNLGLAVVIPVYDEPRLERSLQSLRDCEPPPSAVEVLLVFNNSENDAEAVRLRNQRTRQSAVQWIEAHSDPQFHCHVLNFPDLPAKHAGVGLARKIGMDEAAARFCRAGQLETGVIICFDADCLCAKNFLIENYRHFAEHLGIAGCSTYFEHPLDGSEYPALCQAAAAYELHLRYYVEALRWAGYPYAYHTVGSAMSVRGSAYLRLGGMNRRKAGEDFYFFQKLMRDAGAIELNTTTVYPSARPSHRVPFGTGKAIRRILAGEPQTTYALQAFLDLQALAAAIQSLEQTPRSLEECFPAGLPAPAAEFLEANRCGSAIREISANVGSLPQFQRRFWRWFDGFRCMKFLNWVSAAHYPKIPAAMAAAEPRLLERVGGREQTPRTLAQLLPLYRNHQRQIPRVPNRFPLGREPKTPVSQSR